jgi:hypothetical protein
VKKEGSEEWKQNTRYCFELRTMWPTLFVLLFSTKHRIPPSVRATHNFLLSFFYYLLIQEIPLFLGRGTLGELLPECFNTFSDGRNEWVDG